MTIISLNRASLAFGHVPLLDKAELQVALRERLCIVGRNGTGKSSLLKVLKGEILLDEGDLQFIGSPRVAYLPQDPPPRQDQRVLDYVVGGEALWQQQLAEYDALSEGFATDPSIMPRFEQLQHEMETHNTWQAENSAQEVIQLLGLLPAAAPRRPPLSLSDLGKQGS